MTHAPINWIEAPRQTGFDGALILLNMSSEERLTKEYEEGVRTAVNLAHADGWMVAYVNDNTIGAVHPPDFVEYMEEMDRVRLASTVTGNPELCFSEDFEERRKGFVVVANYFRVGGADFSPVGGPIRIMGRCKIGGTCVLLPQITP